MREEEKFLEKFILARGRTMTLPRATPGKREFHSVFRLTRVAESRRFKRIPPSLEKLFHSKNGGMGTVSVPNRNRKRGLDRSALPPLCLRFTFAERRNFHPLSSDKSWGRWASDMENRCHERDVSVAGGLHSIEMHLSKI